MAVNNDSLKSYIIGIFSNIPGFDVEGLNGEPELLTSLIENAQMINANFNTPINMSDVSDAREINDALKEMASKCGRASSDKSQVSFLQLYLARVYINIKRLPKIEYDSGLTKDNFENHTISASISIDGGGLVKPKLIFSMEDDRLSVYKGYKSLPDNQKQLFKRELRKKVIAHELNHASVCRNSPLGVLTSFEEILVERMALRSQKITRTLETDEYNYGYSKKSPNPESSNYRIYGAGELLSKIIGEEKLQTARLLGVKKFSELIQQELGVSAVALNGLLDASADKQIAHKRFNGQTPELSRINAQIGVEAFLVSKFKEKKLKTLQKPDNLTEQELYQLYRDCADIKKLILKNKDKDKANQMDAVKDLKEIIERLDEVCIEKGIDSEVIKKDIITKKAIEDAHYVSQNNITNLSQQKK